jgi:HEAT repeat protein
MRRSILIFLSLFVLCSCQASIRDSQVLSPTELAAREANRKLIELSKSADPQERAAAFEEMMQLQTITPAVAVALDEYGNKELDDRGRLRVGQTLAIAGVGKYTVKSLIELLGNKDGEVRANAAKILGHIGAEAKKALKALKRVASKDEDYIKRIAGNAVRKIERAIMIRNN